MTRARALVAACLVAGACRGDPSEGPPADSPPDTAAPPAIDADTARQAGPSSVVAACGRARVNVTVRGSAVGLAQDPAGMERGLREAAARVLEPLSDRVLPASVELSPAIRAFRVTMRDTVGFAVALVLTELRRNPDVEAAEPDDCTQRALTR
jgi:hypothetical protein